MLFFSLVFLLFLCYIGGKTPDPKSLVNKRTYIDIMQENEMQREKVGYNSLQFITLHVT